ncbi:hypothetical protein ACIBVL_31605 [Streptomyces sp. NPDC049687]|uniref:hypothetical protein n=1 Tax=Streptomyces sp. NPDC049687 TaxID=3365596 RepID=UPI00378DC49A
MRQTSERPQGRKGTLTVLPSVMSAAALIFGVSACGGNDESTEEPTLTASQVCDSTLDSSATSALKRMGNTEKFTELPGTMNSGEPSKFSLKRSAKTIYEDMTQRNQCVVFKAGDKTGHPLMTVDFSAVNYHPRADDASQDEKSENVIYPIGLYAKTNGNASAAIYFKCSAQASGTAKESEPYIKASLTSAPGQVSVKSTGQDLVTVLNAVSRAMAEQLDCASEAALPTQVPKPTTG